MDNIIKEAVDSDMNANTIEYLQFLNHVMNQMIELEDLLKNDL